MAGDNGAFDTRGPLAIAAVKGSQIDDVTGAHLLAIEVTVAEDGTAIDGGDREQVYGSLGAGGRPLSPETDGTAAKVVCARASSGDLPVLGARDVRIEAALEDPPDEGTVWHAGYHGACLRFDVVDGEARSVVTISDGAGRKLVLDDQGVRAPTSPLIQGDPGLAQDVALAQPLVSMVLSLDAAVLSTASAMTALAALPALAAAAAALGAAATALTAAHTAMAPYLVPGSPSAPTTRAPDLRGAPGA